MIYRIDPQNVLDIVRQLERSQLARDFVRLMVEIEDWNFHLDALDRWIDEGGAEKERERPA